MNFINNEYIKDDGTSPSRAKIGGTSSKRIVYVKTSYLKQFVSEIKSGNDNYICYANDLIKSGYTPEYVKAVVKAPRGSNISFLQNNSHIFNEILASRMANELDIKTAYAIDMSINQRPHAIVLYFLKENENIMDFNKFSGIEDDVTLSMSKWHEYIVEAFKFRYPDMSDDERNVLIDKFVLDFSQLYFFKTFIIGDGDFSFRNVVVINDGTNSYLGPSHDNEMGFDAFCTGTNIKQDLFDDFAQFMMNYNPKVFNTLIQKTTKLSRNIDDIITKEIYDEEEQTRLKRFCNARFQSLFNCINNFENNKEL